MTFFKNIFFVVFALSLFSSASAVAQSSYVPTSAWLVGPASLAASMENAPGKVPCVVANQYNNGFVLRFSGGDGKLLALAVDFKQKAFKANQKYDAELDVPGAFFQAVSGSAYDETTIIFNLQKVEGLYDALKEADEFSLKVYNTKLPFALMGLADGFKRMEVCSNPSVTGPVALAPPVAPNPRSTAPAKAVPEVQTPQNPLIARDGGLIPMPGDAALPPVQDQQRGAGLPVSDLMAKAQQAEQVAQELVKNSPQRPQPPQGEQLARSWSDAAPAQNAQKTDVKTDIMGKKPANETYVRREMRWRALKGANLREVLKVWADGSGAELIWLAKEDFAVQRSMSQQSTIESAAQTLLEQFNDMNPRPVGRVYREPGTSRLVLVVESAETP
jgi:hypothetical protein